MDKKTELRFGPDGTTASILFASGTESETYGSQQEILGAIPDLLESKDITSEEAVEIARAALSSETLPVQKERDLLEELFDGPLGFMLSSPFGRMLGGGLGLGVGAMSIGGLGALDGIFRRMIEQKIFPEIRTNEPIGLPVFRMCSCGKHGMILFTNEKDTYSTSGTIKSKEKGAEFIERFKKDHELTPAAEEKLRKEISEAPLVETEAEVTASVEEEIAQE